MITSWGGPVEQGAGLALTVAPPTEGRSGEYDVLEVARWRGHLFLTPRADGVIGACGGPSRACKTREHRHCRYGAPTVVRSGTPEALIPSAPLRPRDR